MKAARWLQEWSGEEVDCCLFNEASSIGTLVSSTTRSGTERKGCMKGGEHGARGKGGGGGGEKGKIHLATLWHTIHTLFS